MLADQNYLDIRLSKLAVTTICVAKEGSPFL